jgi:hypothetical protein
MREVWPIAFSDCRSPMIPRSAAKSLFRNILPASPCGSRFCGQPAGSIASISNGINILADGQERNPLPSGDQNAANSLFRKILRVSPCGSGFCSHHPGSALPNPNEFRILENPSKKMSRGPYSSSVCLCAASLTLSRRLTRIPSHLLWGLL